jgi:Domain of unknown function (DUF4252)
MKKQWMGIILAAATLPVAALAQSTPPPFPVTLEKQLAARASDYTEVTLDRKMLDFAGHFMNKEDDEEGKRIISKLNGIYVRTYEFDKPGQYTAADLESIRHQFETPDWSSLVKKRSKDGDDDSDIYIKMAGSESQGIFILNAEPTELNFVYISGPINPDDLSGISGNFGIPKTKIKSKPDTGASK